MNALPATNFMVLTSFDLEDKLQNELLKKKKNVLKR